MALPVVLDVDTGTDDAAALWWAATSPGIDLVAVTATWGNTTAAQAARNTRAVLVAAGRPDVPVFLGLDGPIGPAPTLVDARLIMGVDGLGDVGFADRVLGPAPGTFPDAVPALKRLTEARPGELTLVAVAPLSTVAAALRADPGLPSRLAGAVVMGGAVGVPGNITAAAEANVGHDPLAAAEVVAAFGAAPFAPMLVPLDATLAAPLTTAELAAVAASPLPGAKDLHEVWATIWPAGRVETQRPGTWPAHDLLAAWCLRDPSVCRWARLPLAVDTGGSAAWGATVADRRARTVEPRLWEIAVGADAGAFRAGVQAWLAAR